MGNDTIRVLLVEDDPDDVLLLREMLDEASSVRFALTHVALLEQGISTAASQQFNVSLLDLSLPDSRGLETFTRFHERLPEMPVVVLTGLDDETVAVGAVHGGAQDYLIKGKVDSTLLVRSIRYAIERQRASYYRALLNQRELFDTAVSQMSDGIVVTDGSWNITLANRAACLLLDLPPNRWQGLSLQDILDKFELTTPLSELMASAEPVSAFDISRTAPPPPLLLDARLSRIFDPDGAALSTVIMLRDVTGERLSRHVQAVFMTAVPHKLRTPLSVMLGYLTMAKRVSPQTLPQLWPEMARVWEKELRQLIAIVERFLDFEALTLPQLEAAPQPTDVRSVADTASAGVRDRYRDKQIDLSLDVAPDAAYVDCREDHLAFVLGELLTNAVKFADKTPVKLRLEVRRESPARLDFRVSDNGPGIQNVYYDRIFVDFFQVEDYVTGQVPGWGVGLRMVREIVQAYGGNITVTSKLGEGSVFSFTLPSGALAENVDRHGSVTVAETEPAPAL
ncbi:MAG: ATP-binding protein [Armatimonadia bacterium]